MSGYPLLLEGEVLHALVVGGGAVAARKAAALLESGATVRVVAPDIAPAIRELAARVPRLALVERAYRADDLGDAELVIAATGDATTDAAVAAEARARHRLVNVAGAPSLGNCVTTAVHRAGELVIAVSAGGVPGAAARIRDALAERFDARYAAAVRALGALRRRLLDADDHARWDAARHEMLGDDFCAAVESGALDERVSTWR